MLNKPRFKKSINFTNFFFKFQIFLII